MGVGSQSSALHVCLYRPVLCWAILFFFENWKTWKFLCEAPAEGVAADASIAQTKT
jgi:hypothetical protein